MIITNCYHGYINYNIISTNQIITILIIFVKVFIIIINFMLTILYTSM